MAGALCPPLDTRWEGCAVHALIEQAGWYGELASLHPLLIGAPLALVLVAGWTLIRRRRS